MSLKAIEMQIALPRTQDAGKIQEQWQQRSQIAHDFASHELKKEEKKKEQSITSMSKAEYTAIGEETDSASGNSWQSNARKKRGPIHKEENNHHPYKGNVIDFSG
ncbi:hypothetical protein [Bacillus testis]|uniref:hypothetical protein n=1 Tax=Bacillus testis TaxID=1622072 RepID=UPI00067F2E7E|nr:hypothetical protein [Bacillus testis]